MMSGVDKLRLNQSYTSIKYSTIMKTHRHSFYHGVWPIVRFRIVGGGGDYPIRRVHTCHDVRKGV